MGTKKYDLFMKALQHLCEVHEVYLEACQDYIRVYDEDEDFKFDGRCFGDRTKEPS